MESQKIYLCDNDGNSGNAGMWALVSSALQNRGVDPSVVAALQNRNNNGDGWGNNSFFDVLLLFILFGWGGNGNGWGGFGNGNGQGGYAATTERQMLMDAIQRNGIDINTLSSTLGCSIGQVESGINSLATQICNLTGQTGMSAQQIINSLQLGNNQIASQLCNCCCEIKDAITRMGYESQLAAVNQTNVLQAAINGTNVGLERGFSNVAFASQAQTCELKQNADLNTRAILAKLDAIEDSRKDREISSLTASLTAANSRAERQAELAPIYKALSDIECKQPSTVTLPNPCAVAVPSCVAAQFGLGGYGFGYPYGYPTAGFTQAF